MTASTLFVVRAGAIGDFVLSIPALSALRRKYSSHRLILAARADVLPLVHGTLADDVIPFDSDLLTPLFVPEGDISEALRTRLGEIELAILWLSGSTIRTVSNNLRRLDVARLLSADPLPNRQHAADHLLGTLAPLGIGPWAAATTPWIPASLPTAQFPWPDPWRLISIHVGSGGAHKRWPLDRFLALAERLAAREDTRVLLLGGPAEEISIPALHPSIAHLVPPKLETLAAILTRSACYIGNDSGPTHLAAALGTPTLALFGPTDPDVWGPRGPHVTILRSPDGRMETITLEAVLESSC